MSIITEPKAAEIIAGWRRVDEADGQDNPAGPLFPSGEFAEQELTMTHGTGGLCGTNCTWSHQRACC